MESKVKMRDYNFKYHLVGRVWTALAIVLFLMVPIAIGLHYGVTPDWKVFGSTAVIIPLLINFISGIAEPIIYAPMLGTNSEYLAFITGNLSNLKIPCVVKAQEICDTKPGTEENEVISTLAVAISTLVTTVIVAIFVLCLGVSNLNEAVTKNKWIMPAFTCVVYALFGSLGGKYVAKNPKLSILPAIVIVILSIILGVTGIGGSVGSAYLFVGIGLCAIFAAVTIIREKKKIAAKEEQERLAKMNCEHELENTDESQIEQNDGEGAEDALQPEVSQDNEDINEVAASDQEGPEPRTASDTSSDDEQA